ncbi:MAG: YcxB family protein [Oscillospiraceae bacterium]|nr:YcxB family protein [Oscillospiraceae bacterium]
MAFESLPGVKIKSADEKQTFIIADFFSVYEKGNEIPDIYKWTDVISVTENRDVFIIVTNVKTYRISKASVPDSLTLLTVRAIIEGAIAVSPGVEYSFGKRILPPKTLCVGCEIPTDAYVATGAYAEKEVNNSNVVLLSAGLDRIIWTIFPLATIAMFAILSVFWGDVLNNLIKFIPISLFAGGAVAMVFYLVCAFGAKTLYGRILRDDPALLEEITFVVCDEGFIAAESGIYDFSEIISWNESAYFIETNHVYIVFKNKKAVFWLPKRLFPKDKHSELSDFIADRLQQR